LRNWDIPSSISGFNSRIPPFTYVNSRPFCICIAPRKGLSRCVGNHFRYHENIRLQIGPGHLISIPQYLNSKFKDLIGKKTYVLVSFQHQFMVYPRRYAKQPQCNAKSLGNHYQISSMTPSDSIKAQKLFMKLSKIVWIPIATDTLYQAKSYRRQNQRRTTQAVFLSPRVGLQYTYGYLSSHSATSNNSNCSPQNVA
jgi:hypothetical protein